MKHDSQCRTTQIIPSRLGTATGGGLCPAALPGLSLDLGGGAGLGWFLFGSPSSPSGLDRDGVDARGEPADGDLGDGAAMRADCGVRGVGEAGLDLGYEVAPGEVVVICGTGGTGGTPEAVGCD